ncbi:hypothetical protein GCM10017557_56120 [Streptomyces aurantiacus]|uniref:Uncharacterized protein n=1 Tax=Streptomyces aurantiacus TaxID=47760 RepID=A0A7G1P4M0_9ACTN|nr:hypothetical protein GCM10017557_56120 [Streptomyces aurantiacus]
MTSDGSLSLRLLPGAAGGRDYSRGSSGVRCGAVRWVDGCGPEGEKLGRSPVFQGRGELRDQPRPTRTVKTASAQP